MKISELPFPPVMRVRIPNCLSRYAGVEDTETLAHLTREQFLAVFYLGPRSAEALTAACKQVGITWPKENT